MKGIVWVALGSLVLCVGAHAASFDCAKAQSKVEKLICGDAELSKLDEELNAAYKAALQYKQQSNAVKQAQKQWLKERNRCSVADCLEMAYQGRIAELNSEQTKDRFMPILTKDKPMCEDYRRYVEHEVATKNQYTLNASPMCQRNFGEAFPEFTSVKWREIEPEDQPELAVQAYRYMNFWPWNRPEVASNFTDSQFKAQLGNIKLNHKNNWWHMWLGDADIGNTGHMETLLRVEDGRCGEESMTGRPPRWRIPVMVVDATGKGIDTAKSEWVLGVSVLPKPVHFPQNFTYVPGIHETGIESYDIFIRHGITYFDRIKDTWVITPYVKYDNRFATYTIYQVVHDEPQLICRFKFKKQVN